jgi:hypothetical protein
MHLSSKHDDVTIPANQPGLLAPDTSGMNFYRADPALTDLLRIHLPVALFRHSEPHLDRLGALAGGHLDECARLADCHVPVLHQQRSRGPPRHQPALSCRKRSSAGVGRRAYPRDARRCPPALAVAHGDRPPGLSERSVPAHGKFGTARDIRPSARRAHCAHGRGWRIADRGVSLSPQQVLVSRTQQDLGSIR